MDEYVDYAYYKQDVNTTDVYATEDLRAFASLGTDTSFDTTLGDLARSAQGHVENYMGRPYAKTTERNFYPCLAKVMRMKASPYLDLNHDSPSLKYTDEDGNEQEIDDSKYFIHVNAVYPSVRITDDSLSIEVRENDPTPVWLETMTGMQLDRNAQDAGKQAIRILFQALWFGGPNATIEVVSPEAWRQVQLLLDPHRRGSM